MLERNLNTSIMLVPFQTMLSQDLNEVVKLRMGDPEMAVKCLLIHMEQKLPFYASLQNRFLCQEKLSNSEK